MAKYLTINQCIKTWKMTAKDLRKIAERFMEAAEELDKSEVKP